MDLEKNVELRSFSEVDLRCPLCHHIFINPVLLSCSHNVCEYCVRRFWEHKACKVCPVCQRRISMDFPPVNLALRNWSETFIQEKRQKSSSGICSAHKEKLKLFCLDDQEPVCLVCRDSRKHTNHRFSPVDEAIKAHQTERWIKAEFEELHQFLRDEEAIRITALREEEKQRSQMMKQKIDETMCICFLSLYPPTTPWKKDLMNLLLLVGNMLNKSVLRLLELKIQKIQ
uniref:Uncharacterized protein n=1 Tax=Cyprinus carpio TaxID=7962 RepID=A0A8C1VHK3_CYPCA